MGVGIVRRPVDQIGSIRIACSSEVRPVLPHLFGKLLLRGRLGNERDGEKVEQLGAMVGAKSSIRWAPSLGDRSWIVEFVAEGWSDSREHLRSRSDRAPISRMTPTFEVRR